MSLAFQMIVAPFGSYIMSSFVELFYDELSLAFQMIVAHSAAHIISFFVALLCNAHQILEWIFHLRLSRGGSFILRYWSLNLAPPRCSPYRCLLNEATTARRRISLRA